MLAHTAKLFVTLGIRPKLRCRFCGNLLGLFLRSLALFEGIAAFFGALLRVHVQLHRFVGLLTAGQGEGDNSRHGKSQEGFAEAGFVHDFGTFHLNPMLSGHSAR